MINANRLLGGRISERATILATHPRVKSFRNRGMIWAFEVDSDDPQFSRKIFTEGLRRQLLLRPIGRSLYFMPPYVINDDEIEHLMQQTLAVIDAVR